MVLLPVLQAVSRPDTIIARMIPERGLLDWTNGILQLVLLLLGVATLVTLVMLLLTVRRGVSRLTAIVDDVTRDTKPLLVAATGMVTDTREIVAMLRTDVERFSDAAGAMSDQLHEVAEATARRVDDVNAVLDVLQHELEATAITTVAALSGIRSGLRGGARSFRARGSSPRSTRRRDAEPTDP